MALRRVVVRGAGGNSTSGGRWALLLLLVVLLTAADAWGSARSLVRIGSDVTVEEGRTVGHAVAIGGQLTVDGTVEGHAVAIGGSVVLGTGASVEGNVVAIGGIIVAARGAEVGGSLTELNTSNISAAISEALSGDWEGWSWVFAVVSVLIFAAILLFSLILVAFIPRHIGLIGEAISRNPVRVTFWGILGGILIVNLVLLLIISVIGIFLLPWVIPLLLCMIMPGLTALAARIGRVVRTRLLRSRNDAPLREVMWGLAVLLVVGWIPYLGVLVKLAAVTVSLGGTLLTAFGTREI
ncbi:MAG TPA: hypothetical protein PLB96_03620 [Syntrophales bacterium]|nr:hypothetical protein [Syntrophales bacterium]